MRKVPFCMFQEFLGLVNTFTAERFLQTSLVMHLNKYVFQSQSLPKYLTYEAHFFFRTLEIACKYQKTNAAKSLGLFR